jgi:hypothetical protein
MATAVQRLRRVVSTADKHDADPWRMKLEQLKGREYGSDGLERVTTKAIFDLLEVPSRNRATAANRRLSKLMSELGWEAVRVRGSTTGYRDRARGYARPLGTKSYIAR